MTIAALATAGGISAKQVRKWLANRRVRTCNTLTYNGALHPRRLRRLRDQQRQRQTVHLDRAEATEPRQPLHSTPVPTAAVGPSPSAAGLRVTPAAGSFHDGAFQISTPLSGAFRRRGDYFEADSTSSRDSATGVRHHPYYVTGMVASTNSAQTWMPPTAAAGMRRAAYFTATAAATANFASIQQMATGQLNVFNVFNSV